MTLADAQERLVEQAGQETEGGASHGLRCLPRKHTPKDGQLTQRLALGLALALCAQTGVEYAFLNAPYSEAKDFIYTLASGSFYRAADMVSKSMRVSLYWVAAESK